MRHSKSRDKSSKSRDKKKTRPRSHLVPFLVLGAVLAVGGGYFLLAGSSAPAVSGASAAPAATPGDSVVGSPTGDRPETEAFVAYNRSIELTPDQHRVYVEALDGLRAPCCDEYSAATCCCECNLARATWGLAKHLVADEGYGAGDVRAAVADWFDTVNPDGFTGDACFTGGCGRSFARNGCGGMSESRLVF
jgi:hypothetical protein